MADFALPGWSNTNEPREQHHTLIRSNDYRWLEERLAYLRAVPVLGTLWAGNFYVLDKILDAVSPGNAVEKQAKAASDLIKAGRENGVRKMKVTMDEKAGAHLDVPIEGIKVSASLGTQGKTVIEVEYK